MKATNYYNEHDPKAAAWLRELIRRGHIPAGEVDTRDIRAVRATDLVRFTQCHFFAGIGGWSLALRLAGWPDDEPVWTGSCPCQPFSAAGKQLGTADPRHLWPAFRRLICHGAPAIVFGEQVASAAGRQWLAGVRANLETMGYAVGSADLCAAGVGAPHIRQRLFWVAESESERRRTGPVLHEGNKTGDSWPLHGSSLGRLAHAEHDGRRADKPGRQKEGREVNGRAGGLANAADSGRAEHERESGQRRITGPDHAAECAGVDGRLGDTPGAGRERQQSEFPQSRQAEGRLPARPGNACRLGDAALPQGARLGQQCEQLHGPTAWSDYDLIPCADGKARRIEPGTFPLAHGVPGRVGLLRGYGNAIVPQVAQAFVTAWLETQ